MIYFSDNYEELSIENLGESLLICEETKDEFKTAAQDAEDKHYEQNNPNSMRIKIRRAITMMSNMMAAFVKKVQDYAKKLGVFITNKLKEFAKRLREPSIAAKFDNVLKFRPDVVLADKAVGGGRAFEMDIEKLSDMAVEMSGHISEGVGMLKTILVNIGDNQKTYNYSNDMAKVCDKFSEYVEDFKEDNGPFRVSDMKLVYIDKYTSGGKDMHATITGIELAARKDIKEIDVIQRDVERSGKKSRFNMDTILMRATIQSTGDLIKRTFIGVSLIGKLSVEQSKIISKMLALMDKGNAEDTFRKKGAKEDNDSTGGGRLRISGATGSK